MHLRIRKELDELRARWPTLDLGSGSQATMPEHFELSIRDYCGRPDNHDGRGVRSAGAKPTHIQRFSTAWSRRQLK